MCLLRYLSSNGKILMVYMTDNVRGDDILTGEDGGIVDPRLPIISKNAPGGAKPIPTLSFWGLLMLTALISIFGKNAIVRKEI